MTTPGKLVPAGYKFEVDTVQLPGCGKDVRLLATTHDNTLIVGLRMAPKIARALAKTLLEQAWEAESRIIAPGQDSVQVPQV